MVPLVQLVRASDCGSECHGFESHRAPSKEVIRLPFFYFLGAWLQKLAQRKKSVDLHFLLHRHKAGGASPLGAACFEALAYVFASADASLRILMTPRQKNERFFAMVCQFKYGFSLSRCPQELEIFYTRTAAGEVRQASCTKRLRKLSPRACYTFLC